MGHAILSGVEIFEPSGERWELALDLLRSGEDEVTCESVGLRRNTSGPRATGHIDVSILSRHPAEVGVATERQQSEVEAGRRVVHRLTTGDQRLQSLLDEFGVTWAYVADYGNGRVLITNLPPG